MRIVATLMVKDEAETIKAHLDYHLANGVCAYLITDNGSSDDTVQIAFDHPGVIWVGTCQDDSYPQAEMVSRMADIARHLHPDWIIHTDADEFWEGLETLANVPADIMAVRCPLYDHPPVPGLEPGPIRRECMPYRKWAHQYKVAHRPMLGVRVAMGNHFLESHDSEVWNQTSVEHYPVRSFEQFERKVRNGAQAMRNGQHPDYICDHWRRWGEALDAGTLRQVYESMLLRDLGNRLLDTATDGDKARTP